jgi:hypothetical protein
MRVSQIRRLNLLPSYQPQYFKLPQSLPQRGLHALNQKPAMKMAEMVSVVAAVAVVADVAVVALSAMR